MRGHAPPLAEVEEFVDRAFPTMLRRLCCWKGLRPHRHADVLQDLHQDLLLDCLENADHIRELSPRERNGRWFRLLEQRHYQIRLRDRRRFAAGTALDEIAESERTSATEHVGLALAVADRQRTELLLHTATHLKNGRLNTEITAQRLGMHPREVRALWGRVAGALGYDEQFLGFWRRRLVEALLGLVADWLRDRQLVRLHDEAARARPDPRARLRRIRQIKACVSVRPLPRDMKNALAQFTRRGAARGLDPWLAMRAARDLLPGCVGVHLWHFELAVAHGRLVEAALALRRARAARTEPVRCALARARLLEAAGREESARAVLLRSAAHHRGDRRLTAALRELEAP